MSIASLAQTRAERSLDWAIRAATWAQTRLLCRMPKCASAKRRRRAAVGMRVGGEAVGGTVQKPGPVVLELYRKPTVGRRPTALCKRNATRATNAAHHGLDMVLSGVRKGYSAGYAKGGRPCCPFGRADGRAHSLRRTRIYVARGLTVGRSVGSGLPFLRTVPLTHKLTSMLVQQIRNRVCRRVAVWPPARVVWQGGSTRLAIP